MASPVLNEDTLSCCEVEGIDGELQPSQCLTVRGTAVKALFLSVLLFGSCMLLRSFPAAAQATPLAVLISLLITVIFGVITVYNPQLAPVTGSLFSIAEGVTLSCLAGFVNFEGDLVFGDAVFSTVAVVFVMLVFYCFFAIKMNGSSAAVLLGTLFGPFVYYLLAFIISLTGIKTGVFSLNPWVLACSVALSAVAAFNISHDFKNIQAGVDAKTHKVLEWYCAFALMFNLLWIYIELVRMIVCLLLYALWWCFWYSRPGSFLDFLDDD